jgi:hypothetical protein
MIIPMLAHASFEGRPCRYCPSGGEAWWYRDGAWHPVNSAEVFMGAAVMTGPAFRKRFGGLDVPRGAPALSAAPRAPDRA